MKICRICDSLLGKPLYSSLGPSITSVRTVIDVPMSLFLCPQCFHAQKPALHDTSNYYDNEYRISLQSDDFDQLYNVIDGKNIYRTDYQAEVVLKSTDIPVGSKILDYGAGKASTLKKVLTARPDIIPFVFDVSKDYRVFWQQFLPQDQQATYQIPESWSGTFSLITAHFVLEHAENPCGVFFNVSRLLAPDGVFFFSVPNILSNPGDLLAVDHINHYSITSINVALTKANLTLVGIDNSIFRGAIICVAKCNNGVATQINRIDSVEFEREIKGIARFWSGFDTLLEVASKTFSDVPSAIFGAGIYGSYILSKIGNQVSCKCFLDNSPHLINSIHMGLPVLAPSNMPIDICVIYAGLNPNIARSVIEPLRTYKIQKIVYFDEGEF